MTAFEINLWLMKFSPINSPKKLEPYVIDDHNIVIFGSSNGIWIYEVPNRLNKERSFLYELLDTDNDLYWVQNSDKRRDASLLKDDIELYQVAFNYIKEKIY